MEREGGKLVEEMRDFVFLHLASLSGPARQGGPVATVCTTLVVSGSLQTLETLETFETLHLDKVDTTNGCGDTFM